MLSQFSSNQYTSASRASLRRSKRAEHRPPDRGQFGNPSAPVVGLHMAGPADPDLTKGGEVDLLAVDFP